MLELVGTKCSLLGFNTKYKTTTITTAITTAITAMMVFYFVLTDS